MAEADEIRIPSGDQLLRVLYKPANANLGTALLCHGIIADLHESGFFDRMAEALVARGVSVLRFDYRGHGKSSGTSLDVSLRGELQDVRSVYSWLRGKKPGSDPLAVVSASFSFSSALRLCLEEPVAGFLLINPVFSYRDTFVDPLASWGRSIAETRGGKDLPAGACARIPGTEFFLSETLWEEMTHDETPQLAAKLTCPTLAFHGDKDEKVPLQPLLSFVERHSKIIDLEVVHGEGHGLKGSREFFFKKAIDWVIRRLENE